MVTGTTEIELLGQSYSYSQTTVRYCARHQRYLVILRYTFDAKLVGKLLQQREQPAPLLSDPRQGFRANCTYNGMVHTLHL
jgi:hypothetical protein